MGLSADRFLRAFTLCGAIASQLAMAPHAFADPRVVLEWQASPACPARAWLHARVERYLDAELKLAGDAELVVDARITGAGHSFFASVELRSPEGLRTRQLSDGDCLVVADAVAFIVAQAIDPHVQASDAPMTAEEVERGREGGGGQAGASPASVRESEGTDAGQATAGRDRATAGEGRAAGRTDAGEAAVGADVGESGDDGGDGGDGGAGGDGGGDDGAVEDADDDLDEDADEDADEAFDEELPEAPSPPLQIGASAGFALVLGWQPLPAASPGVVAHGVLHVGAGLRLELGAGYYAPQSNTLGADPSAAARFERYFGTLGICVMAAQPQTSAGLCLGAQGGVVHGTSVAFTGGRDRSLPELALSLGPLLVHRLGARVSLRVELAPSVGVVRPRFLAALPTDSDVVVHTAEVIGFFGRIGLELRFD